MKPLKPFILVSSLLASVNSWASLPTDKGEHTNPIIKPVVRMMYRACYDLDNGQKSCTIGFNDAQSWGGSRADLDQCLYFARLAQEHYDKSKNYDAEHAKFSCIAENMPAEEAYKMLGSKYRF